MIQTRSNLKGKLFEIKSKMPLGYSYHLYPGTIVKLKKFDDDDVCFCVEGYNEAVELAIQECRDKNYKNDLRELKALKDGLEVWVKEPEKFVFEERHGFGKHWWHIDGKKCKYSYLDTLGYFFTKEEFEKNILEKTKSIVAHTSNSDYQYFKDLILKEKHLQIHVDKFNKHI